MRAPEFWRTDSLAARLLAPLSALYAGAVARRLAGTVPVRAPVPVICVGNIVAGGAGKTPVCLALADMLAARGARPHLLTRGYGGTEAGPRLVDPLRHDAARVGDEALLLAARAPTWVARCRPDGAVAAAEMGAGVVVMDDGFQNPSLHKDLSLVVVDGGYGFGNGRVIPAGPCREPVAIGLDRADAVVLVGDDQTGVLAVLAGRTVLRARLVPGPEAEALRGRRVAAFAGIGRPAKFFDTLAACGAELAAARSFPDHHPFARAEILRLLDEAIALDAIAVTTAKDAIRLPPDLRPRVMVLTVALQWEDTGTLDRLLGRLEIPA
ncbi:tetraacyldisaccharide 4'-kinase [Magnetospirillum sp. UT-4]|uniref:tetraacyldisaccharide 4'-kinase n=1 Tax=Magnetospirillum sp. UT-4 TaxID=2681467 RepID=UPI00138283A6|nr:tetraacyldisaccharide 4'-kinase [Magnetospirillum sp. UT-4]CAA7620104.1 Tetraacyldisaccharide 4'-kinase [Magnetospirillum sp. UT-4]